MQADLGYAAWLVAAVVLALAHDRFVERLEDRRRAREEHQRMLARLCSWRGKK